MNNDQVVDSDDAILLLRHTLNPQRYQVVEANCDVNIDKAIDSDDAIIIQKYVDGTINELPYVD